MTRHQKLRQGLCFLSFFLSIFNCYYGKSPNIHKSENNNKLPYTHNPASKIISMRLILLPLWIYSNLPSRVFVSKFQCHFTINFFRIHFHKSKNSLKFDLMLLKPVIFNRIVFNFETHPGSCCKNWFLM